MDSWKLPRRSEVTSPTIMHWPCRQVLVADSAKDDVAREMALPGDEVHRNASNCTKLQPIRSGAVLRADAAIHQTLSANWEPCQGLEMTCRCRRRPAQGVGERQVT
jgi:hypothetical protein